MKSMLEKVSVSLFFLFSLNVSALGQVESIAPVSITNTTTDPFGNARGIDIADRPRSLAPEDIAAEGNRGYQVLGRRLSRGGGFAGFALPTDILALTHPSLFRNTLSEYESGPIQRDAYQRYGGFDRRSDSALAKDIPTIFARRYALVQATGYHAAVRRSLWRTGPSALGLRASTAYSNPAGVSPVPANVDPALDLNDVLRVTSESSRLRVRSAAWKALHEGDWHKAARAFDATLTLDPSDSLSRLGAVFCAASAGSQATAAALTGQLARWDDNPLALDLSSVIPASPGIADDAAVKGEAISEGRRAVGLSDFLPSSTDYRALKTRLKAHAAANADDPDRAALVVLMLWYLGDRAEAKARAVDLRIDFPGSDYADWAAKMP